MKSKECFEKGLLRKIPAEKERVESALRLSSHYLERAGGNLEIEYFDVAFLMAYNSMLQTARALLFSDGVKERSHYCAVEYLREKYSGEKDLSVFVELLDNYRQNRHATQYDGQLVTEKEAREAVADALKFLALAKKKIK